MTDALRRRAFAVAAFVIAAATVAISLLPNPAPKRVAELQPRPIAEANPAPSEPAETPVPNGRRASVDASAFLIAALRHASGDRTPRVRRVIRSRSVRAISDLILIGGAQAVPALRGGGRITRVVARYGVVTATVRRGRHSREVNLAVEEDQGRWFVTDIR